MALSFLKSGRWAYAEERHLIDLMGRQVPVREAALQLRRSEESIAKKLVDLGLAAAPAQEPSREQLRQTADALKQRERAARFHQLAMHEPDDFIAGRLTAMAVEQDEMAIAMEARAKSQ